jgi:hypothetical protein
VVFFCELHLGSPNFKLDWSRSSGYIYILLLPYARVCIKVQQRNMLAI